MLILQNAFSGILLAFVIVLLFVVLIVLGHSIGSTISSDCVNMGILKTVGLDSGRLRLLQLLQYGIPSAAGLVIGFLLCVPLGNMVADAALTTTGVLIPETPPLLLMAMAFIIISFLLALFIFIRTRRIVDITPMKAMRGETDGTSARITKPAAFDGNIHFRLAFRQLLSGKSRYIGAFVVAVLLTFFASLGGLIGTIIVAVITDPIVSSVMKQAGISNFSSEPNFIGLILPMVVVTFLFAAFGWLSAIKIRKVPFTVLTAE